MNKRELIDSDFKLRKGSVLHSLFLLVAALLIFSSCDEQEKPKIFEPYDGPIMEGKNVKTLYSDSAIVRLRVNAPVQYEHQNHDRDFPKGVMIEFFDTRGNVTTTLTSNYGEYKNETGLYMAKGNVLIENPAKGEKLESEQLYWDPKTERIYTNEDVQVRIQTPTETIWGTGLEAKQDFTFYKILNPQGILSNQ